MRKKYKNLLILIGIEWFIAYVMGANGVRIHSFAGSAIGTLLFILPIQILLFCVYKDQEFTEWKRLCAIFVFWFINVCYIVVGAAKLMQ